jgi:spore coat protein A
MIDRRKFIQAGVAAGLASSVPFRLFVRDAYGEAGMVGLSDPFLQPKFVNLVADALAPGFKFVPNAMGEYKVKMRQSVQNTGLVDAGRNALPTRVWGYQDSNVKKSVPTWPGKTFEVQSSLSGGGAPETVIRWINKLPGRGQHLLPVDTNLHWCYSLHGYENNSIAKNGVPLITHLHGGHSDYQFDGNPEFFYSPGGKKQVVGPQWDNVPGGFTDTFRYDNNVPAGNLWYHDHALGLTRLNVYAGLAGFYFVRDEYDTGLEDNPIGLPAWPYEKAYAIQDRMFRDTGELFYSSMPGEPFYSDFIIDENGDNILEDYTNEFPGGGPTALAEFFGDHMVVNGMIWPKEDVEPRNYRMHLLNGTDSRFMLLEFRHVAAGDTNPANGTPVPFTVIGSDQGLSSQAKVVTQLMFEPGSRYDVVVDFSNIPADGRVIMTNLLGDSPFGGDLPGPDDRFPDSQTDRVMAFDVSQTLSAVPDNFSVAGFNLGTTTWNYSPSDTPHTVTRKVALFEGTDEFGRLQPLLGTAEPVVDAAGNTVSGAIAWHMPTTENPELGATEIWEIYNTTGDAHPVHLHLVNFEVLGRQEYTSDVIEQPVEQHNGAEGMGFRLENIVLGDPVYVGDEYIENAPKDMVTALPEQVTRIKATFDKPGRYVWHCHILSHEDHEMMRVLHVGKI